MIIINETEDKKLKNRNVVVPPKIRQIASKILKDNYGSENIANKRNSNSRPGYKLLKHIVDPSYNKNKKLPNEPDNKGNTDLTKPVKMPSITTKKLGQELSDPNMTGHKLQNTLQSWANSEINKERGKVKSNEFVPKVKKTARPKDDVKKPKMTGAEKFGSGSLTINSSVTPKIINLSENQLLSIIDNISKNDKGRTFR